MVIERNIFQIVHPVIWESCLIAFAVISLFRWTNLDSFLIHETWERPQLTGHVNLSHRNSYSFYLFILPAIWEKEFNILGCSDHSVSIIMIKLLSTLSLLLLTDSPSIFHHGHIFPQAISWCTFIGKLIF